MNRTESTELSPVIDYRKQTDIEQQVTSALKKQFKGTRYQNFDPESGFNPALRAVFGRFMKIIIERLNKAPNKNFLAFLDLLGESRTPPQPAKVPLKFELAAGSSGSTVVPVGTQVAAPPPEGSSEPIIFETEKELVVSAADLCLLYVQEPTKDTYSDYGLFLNAVQDTDCRLFRGESPVEHYLYIGHQTLFGYRNISTLTITLDPDFSEFANPLKVKWQAWNGQTWQDQDLSGNEKKIEFKNPVSVQPSIINSVDSRWIRCKWLKPVIKPVLDQPITGINLCVTLDQNDLAAENLFFNDLKLDDSKDFCPFGEKPKFGDVFYVSNDDAFSIPGNKTTLSIKLTDEKSYPLPQPSPDLELAWEYWQGTGWSIIRQEKYSEPAPETLTKSGDIDLVFENTPQPNLVNGVEAFWVRVRIVAGNYGTEAHYREKLQFTVDSEIAKPLLDELPSSSEAPKRLTEITHKQVLLDAFAKAGIEISATDPFSIITGISTDMWNLTIKVNTPQPGTIQTYLLVKEDSGSLVVSGQEVSGYHLIPASFAPPSLEKISIGYQTNIEDQAESVFAYDDFAFCGTWDPSTPGKSTVQPFVPMQDKKPTLYLGFDPPPGKESLPNQPVSLFFNVLDKVYSQELPDFESATDPSSDAQLSWEYWNGEGWQHLIVVDETETLTRPGLIQFIAPVDLKGSIRFGVEKNWVRVCYENPESGLFQPVVNAVILNITQAVQAVTIKNETLGSGDGSVGQSFSTARSPVLKGQTLEIMESGSESTSQDSNQQPGEWIPWIEMPDFYASGSQDRHYLINHLTGELTFGDGQNGMIPPKGVGNIRMTSYCVGGGLSGNCSVGTISQLKSSVPYINSVSNPLAAEGGADSESIPSFQSRAPKFLRHGNLAVTTQDTEDMAMLASSEIARAKCVPLVNLSEDPTGRKKKPGQLSIIVVPDSDSPMPQPGVTLMQNTCDALKKVALPLIDVWVVGPVYLRVDVEVKIIVSSLQGAGDLEKELIARLDRFLHPLTGGETGEGWAFGRVPQKSDLYTVIGSIPDVDHIEFLDVSLKNNMPESNTESTLEEIEKAKLFLICPGRYTIEMALFESSD